MLDFSASFECKQWSAARASERSSELWVFLRRLKDQGRFYFVTETYKGKATMENIYKIQLFIFYLHYTVTSQRPVSKSAAPPWWQNSLQRCSVLRMHAANRKFVQLNRVMELHIRIGDLRIPECLNVVNKALVEKCSEYPPWFPFSNASFCRHEKSRSRTQKVLSWTRWIL